MKQVSSLFSRIALAIIALGAATACTAGQEHATTQSAETNVAPSESPQEFLPAIPFGIAVCAGGGCEALAIGTTFVLAGGLTVVVSELTDAAIAELSSHGYTVSMVLDDVKAVAVR